jgi:hypothetical protein
MMNRDEYAIRAANSVFQPPAGRSELEAGYIILGAIVLLIGILYVWC